MKIDSNYPTNYLYSTNRKPERDPVNTSEKIDFSKYYETSKKSVSHNNDSVITDQDLLNKLVNQYGSNTNAIAKELIKNKAVNPENINPRNCTQLEMEILREHLDGGKERSVKAAFHINFAIRYKTGNGEMKKYSEFAPNAKFDWIQKIQAFSKMQVDLGNTDFINDGTHDAVNDYISKLLSNSYT